MYLRTSTAVEEIRGGRDEEGRVWSEETDECGVKEEEDTGRGTASTVYKDTRVPAESGRA
jgi:hypothetical protein